MTLHHYTVTEEDVNIRLDKLLVRMNESFSRQQIQSWIKSGHVFVNGAIVKANYLCKLDDNITWEFPKPIERIVTGEEIPLEILFEDDFLLVINKPAGMLVHPTQTIYSGTLVNALKFHTKHLSTLGGEDRPGIVHRLDQYTSGLLVVAKDNVTHEHLKSQFKNQSVTRIYEAIVSGEMQYRQGIIRAPIGRDEKNRLKMAVNDDGRPAETHFEVLQYFNDFTHVECRLITGRTHQIRVHLQYINHPIVGDDTYNRQKTKLIPYQALFAKTLGFIHPTTEKYKEFSIARPKAIEDVLSYLHTNSNLAEKFE